MKYGGVSGTWWINVFHERSKNQLRWRLRIFSTCTFGAASPQASIELQTGPKKDTRCPSGLVGVTCKFTGGG